MESKGRRIFNLSKLLRLLGKIPLKMGEKFCTHYQEIARFYPEKTSLFIKRVFQNSASDGS